MAIGAVRSAWPTGSLFEQRDRTVPDVESAVPPAAETGDGVGGKPAQAGRSGLADAGLYDIVPVQKDVAGDNWWAIQLRRAASFG